MATDQPRDEASISTLSSLHEPEPTHRHDSQHISDDELEATELRHMRGDKPRLSRVLTPGKPMLHWYDPLKRLWRHHIRMSVPHDDCRDHLGEWTFSRARLALPVSNAKPMGWRLILKQENLD